MLVCGYCGTFWQGYFSFNEKEGPWSQLRLKAVEDAAYLPRYGKLCVKQRSVFNYEEIEKLSIKAGIPFPSVKEIINSLKADSLIEC